MSKSKSKSGRKPKDFRRGRDARTDEASTEFKGKQDRPCKEKEYGRGDGSNLFSWYNRNPLLTAAAASVPFPYRPGMQMPAIPFTGITSTLINTIPGVMKLSFTPTIGNAKLVTDPISLAAKEMYGRVRKAFSGTLAVDAPDLMLYVMAMDSIFMSIAHMKRVFRIISTYSPMNFAIPEGLLKALTGASNPISDLEQHKMDLFMYINELVGMTKKFYVPSSFDILNRHEWMCDNVYMDANTANSQMFVFVPDGAFIFGLDDEGKGCLDFSGFPFATQSGGWVLSAYTYVRNMIEALANSEDAYTISGYLQRAYEGVEPFVADYMVYDEPFIPYYNEMVLSQIENSKNYGSIQFLGDHAITQVPSTNALQSIPALLIPSGTTVRVPTRSILSVRSDAPTYELIIESTRLVPSVELDSGNYVLYPGTEVVTGNTMYVGNQVLDVNPSLVIEPTSILPNLRALSFYTQWDWAPIYFQTYKLNEAENTILMGDLHNVTFPDSEVMKQINRVCLFSEFDSFPT